MMSFIRRARTAVRRRRAMLAAWRRLSAAERRDFLQFVLLIPAVRLSLRTIGFRRTQAWLVRPLRSGRWSPGPSGPGAIERSLSPALPRASRYAPPRGNCLSQSLALSWMLRRRGVDAELCLGARLDEGNLSAHAWVTSGGRVLNDTPDVHQRFAPLEAAGARAALGESQP